MSDQANHIAVCICTYKRPQLLRRLLAGLAGQQTGGLFTFSIVVADNDYLESAKSVVSDFSATSAVDIVYCVEPRQNIALARNKAIANAEGDFVAFMDDDEFPTDGWLLTLLKCCQEFGADGALGPVKPYFDSEAPSWVVQSKLYDRPTYPTGLVIDGSKGRTGNVLLRAGIFADEAEPFRPEFLTGEDQDFFRRMIEKGYRFVWCDEAVGYEVVPPLRWKRTFMLRRALLRGSVTRIHPSFGPRDVAISAIAVPVYIAALPFAFFVGQDKFMTLLVKLFDHLGKLLACLGIRPVRSQYVTD